MGPKKRKSLAVPRKFEWKRKWDSSIPSDQNACSMVEGSTHQMQRDPEVDSVNEVLNSVHDNIPIGSDELNTCVIAKGSPEPKHRDPELDLDVSDPNVISNSVQDEAYICPDELNTCFIAEESKNEECERDHDYLCKSSPLKGEPTGDNVTSQNLEIESTPFEDLLSDIHSSEKFKEFIIQRSSHGINIIHMYTHNSTPSVRVSLEIKTDFSCDVYVHRCKLPKTHDIWDGLPMCFDRVSVVNELCSRIVKYNVCVGNPDPEYTALIPIGAGMGSNNQPGVLAYHEGDFNAKFGIDFKYSSTIRSVKCDLLTSGKRCRHCTSYRASLWQRKFRITDRDNSNRLFNHSTFKHKDMTRPELLQKLGEQKDEIDSLQHKLWKLRRDYDKVISTKGVILQPHESMEMKDLMGTCQNQFIQSFPDANSRQRLFWEQQFLRSQKTDARGMRWHPMIIRWCLYMRQKSTKAYDAMRDSGFVHLPSTRTLYDYSHFLKSELGFQSDVFQLVRDEAAKKGMFDAEWRSYVGLLFDEIKVKEDLVYDKFTGELVGYCNLDTVGNEMLQFEQMKNNSNPDLAKYMLVVMIRSLTCHFTFPLCGFATTSLTADFLYPIIWRTVATVETQLKLRVLFLTCDGASPNRRFFGLHRVGNEEVVFKTVNPYADDRNIFFISDVPHLLKTTRNNFSNSYSHRRTRTLWKNGKDISWMHIVRMFEEHCELNLYTPCPKLSRTHIDLVSFNYMKCSLAAQVLSDTVAFALEELYGQEVSETVIFIRHANKFFDCLNVRSLFEGRNKRNENLKPYRNAEDPRLDYLAQEFIDYLDSWDIEVKNRIGNFTASQRASMILSHQTITGLKTSIYSICACVKYLLNRGADFVLTHSFNQDPLEQHFGHYRHRGGSNDNPSVYEVRNMMTTLRTVNAQALPTKRGNVQHRGIDNNFIDHTKLPRKK